MRQNVKPSNPGTASPDDATKIAAAIDRDIQALAVRNTATLRAIRRKYSKMCRSATPDVVLWLTRKLLETEDYRWIAYELIQNHPPAFECLGEQELEELGQGINSWWTVDAFARTLSGPAWVNGQVSDRLILQWARSTDPWWRRAALVSTVAWNVRSQGGPGDVPRTLKVCRLLVQDHHDMVSKALSWALRELVVHDAGAVQDFIEKYEKQLSARVKREVKNKLRTGLKNP